MIEYYCYQKYYSANVAKELLVCQVIIVLGVSAG